MIHGIHFVLVSYSLSVVKCVHMHAHTKSMLKCTTAPAINFDRECNVQWYSIDLFVIIIIRVDCNVIQMCISYEELNH